jgi:hypothetical protein
VVRLAVGIGQTSEPLPQESYLHLVLILNFLSSYFQLHARAIKFMPKLKEEPEVDKKSEAVALSTFSLTLINCDHLAVVYSRISLP